MRDVGLNIEKRVCLQIFINLQFMAILEARPLLEQKENVLNGAVGNFCCFSATPGLDLMREDSEKQTS
jgi:hypothetical protein